MSDTADAAHRCDAAVALAFSVLGKRWNGMIVEVLGAGALPFSGVRRAVGTISDAVLADRLVELAGVGLVVRSVEPGPPTTVAYSLSDAGRNLLPVIRQLGEWANDNLDLATGHARR